MLDFLMFMAERDAEGDPNTAALAIDVDGQPANATALQDGIDTALETPMYDDEPSAGQLAAGDPPLGSYRDQLRKFREGHSENTIRNKDQLANRLYEFICGLCKTAPQVMFHVTTRSIVIQDHAASYVYPFF